MKKATGKGWTRRSALSAAGLGVLGGAASCAPKIKARTEVPVNGSFQHGIASGDPLSDRVILWTCITKGGGSVRWEIATDPEFAFVVKSAEIAVAGGKTVPLKVDVHGLKPATNYYYRFIRGENTSMTGRTKTLPVGDVEQISMAIVSCSNHPAGYFHSYAHLAKAEPVDVVLALGDYIYEYGLGGYATEFAEELGRVPEPEHECVTYDDYATRYAQYHRDPDLQAAHAAAPWILTWDDHESANDSWKDGAQNHDPATQGPWAAREAASLKAFYDWTPTREPQDGLPLSANYRRFDFGNLASLTMLETRLSGRSEPITFDQFPVPNDADPNDKQVQKKLQSFEQEILGDETRRMLGDRQSEFVANALQTSVAAGQKWQIIGNQTLFAEIRSPDYMATLPAWLKWIVKRSEPLHYQYFLRSRLNPLLNLDSWDGYPAARERFYNKAKEAGANLLVVTGDTHDFMAASLFDKKGDRIGTELGTSGVSSPGNFAYVSAPGVNFGELTEEKNPALLLHDTKYTGYIRMLVKPDEVLADFVSTSDVRQSKWSAKTEYSFVVNHDELVKN